MFKIVKIDSVKIGEAFRFNGCWYSKYVTSMPGICGPARTIIGINTQTKNSNPFHDKDLYVGVTGTFLTKNQIPY